MGNLFINKKAHAISFAIAAAFGLTACGLTACGGGGGGSTTTSPTPSNPPSANAPTVSVTVSQPKTTVNTPVTVTWSSTNATSCTGLDAMTAGVKATSGSATITPTAGGQYTYTISCDGAGGTAKQSAALVVPMPVKSSSYANAKETGLAPFHVPVLPNVSGSGAHAYAVADFQQNGTYSLLVSPNGDGAWPQDPKNYGKVGSLKFFSRASEQSEWVDVTSTLLKDATGCLSTRKVVVADFNGDSKPDAFVSCIGMDLWPIPAGQRPMEQPRMLLSQADGTYKNVLMDFYCFCHSASAAELNNKGYADLVVTDFNAGNPTGYYDQLGVKHQDLFFLTNNKDGTFTKSQANLPALAKDGKPLSTEFIDFNGDGKFDWWIAGERTLNAILYNNGGNRFDLTTPTMLPMSAFPLNPVYGLALDILVKDGYIYQSAYSLDFNGMAIVKTNFALLTSTLLYEHVGVYPESGVPHETWLLNRTTTELRDSWFPWIQFYNGTIRSVDTQFSSVEVPL